MSTNKQDQENTLGPVPWDPVIALVRERMSEDVPEPPIRLRFPRFNRLRTMVTVAIWSHKISLVFWALAIALLGSGFAVLAWSWPWMAETQDYSGIVSSAATALGFSGLIFSAISLPLSSAAKMASGFSAELLRRPMPWLACSALVVLTAGLFLLATLPPDKAAACASGLLCSGGFALVWAVSRNLMGSSDELDVAQRQVEFLRRHLKWGVKRHRSAVRRALPRTQRSEALAREVSLPGERDLVSGVLRQLREGARGCFRIGRPWQGLTFWTGVVQSFLDYVHAADGNVGERGGLPELVLVTGDELVRAAQQAGSEDVASKILSEMPALCRPQTPAYEYGAVRIGCGSHLHLHLDRTWDDDDSFVPAAAATALSQCARACIGAGDSHAAFTYMDTLSMAANKAHASKRVHIAQASIAGLVDILPDACADGAGRSRASLLRHWKEAILPLVPVRLTTPRHSFFEPIASVFPGINLQDSGGLQRRLWEAARCDVPGRVELLGCMLRILRDALPMLAAKTDREQGGSSLFVVDGLALLYCVCLVGMTLPAKGPDRGRVGGAAAALCMQLFEEGGDHGRGDWLLEADIAELVWSVLLGAAFLQGDATRFSADADALQGLLLEGPIGERRVIRSRFALKFLTGLLIGSGADRGTVTQIIGEAAPRNGGADDMFFTPSQGVGLAPSVNRNRVYTPKLSRDVFELIDDWGCRQFPSFGGFSDQSEGVGADIPAQE